MKHLGLQRIRYIEFAVHHLADHVRFYEQQLFCEPLARTSPEAALGAEHVSMLYGAGEARIVLSEPTSACARAARFLRSHPEGIMCVAFDVEDIAHAFEFLLARGATPTGEIQRAGAFQWFDITTPLGDVEYRFIQSPSELALPGLVPLPERTQKPIQWLGIDHLTANLRTMKPLIDWYRAVMGFEQFWEIEFHTTQLAAGQTRASGSGLKSIVMWDPHSGIKFASNEPLRPFFHASQIERFVEDNHGAGIQHIALAVPSIMDAVDTLCAAGLQFLSAPPAYYEQLPTRFKAAGLEMSRIQEPIAELQRRNILIDGSPEGYMLQIFSDEIRRIAHSSTGAPAFYEVIQRAGDRGFGYGNFRALFEAIETLQNQRSA